MGILRFILAISVLITHAGSVGGYNIVGGKIAVQAFYIISGFYMSMILSEKYIGLNQSYKLFLSNRLLRLFPIYWIVLVFTIILGLITIVYTDGVNYSYFTEYIKYYDSMSFVSFVFLIFTNIFLFLQDTVMFLGLDKISGQLFFTTDPAHTTPLLYKFLFIPQAWTIGVELSFYLIAPFIVRRKTFIIVLMIILSILLRFLLVSNGLKNDPWSYRFFPTELVFFLLGIISYRIYKYLCQKQINVTVNYLIFFIILILTLFFSYIKIQGLYYIYLFLFFISIPFVFTLSKRWTRDRFIGELSYPIYISHMFIISVLNKLNLESTYLYTLYVAVLTIGFSILMNETVAKRIEKFRQRRLLVK